MLDNDDKIDAFKEIIDKLDLLIDDLKDYDKNFFIDYIEDLNQIKYNAMNDLEEAEIIQFNEYEDDLKQRNREYISFKI